jgi:hypothetical protein
MDEDDVNVVEDKVDTVSSRKRRTWEELDS